MRRLGEAVEAPASAVNVLRLFLAALTLLASFGCASLFEEDVPSPRGDAVAREGIDGLFTRYREGIESGDYRRIAGCFESPISEFVESKGRVHDALVRVGEVAAARWGGGDEEFRRFADLMGVYTAITRVDYEVVRAERNDATVRVTESHPDETAEYTVDVGVSGGRWVMKGATTPVAGAGETQVFVDAVGVDEAYIRSLDELARLVVGHHIEYEDFYVAFFTLNDDYLTRLDGLHGSRGEG